MISGLEIMLLLQKITNNKNTEYYKFLNIPVCIIDKKHNFKIKRLFFGLFVKEKAFDNYTETITIKIFNFTVYKRIETLNKIKINWFNLYNREIIKLTEIKKELEKIIDKRYTKVFILKSNLGEAYLFLKFIINNLINCTDIPVIIVTKKAHISLIKMLTPNIDYIVTKSLKYEINEKLFKINNQDIYTVFPIKFYLDTEQKTAQIATNYLYEMYDYFRISNDNKHNFNKIKINENIINEIDNYLARNDINHFIFISKEATTESPIPDTFWQGLESKLDIKIIYNNKNVDIAETYYLAKKASVIISLRSGLSEILSDCENTHIILYTDFKDRYKFPKLPKETIIKSYSVKALELNTSNTFEILYNDKDKDKIIENIINIVKQKERTK